jgi:phage baseplate assembly protein W
MARELGKIKTADLLQNAYKVLGIKINSTSNAGGVFAVNYTTIQQAKDNLINLIMTRKGERVHQPDFGCDIWKIIFEPIVDGDIDVRIENTIVDAVRTWLPYISIDQIVVDYDDIAIDNHEVTVELHFSLQDNPNIGEIVTLTINE